MTAAVPAATVSSSMAWPPATAAAIAPGAGVARARPHHFESKRPGKLFDRKSSRWRERRVEVDDETVGLVPDEFDAVRPPGTHMLKQALPGR
jgi:hypothetical protein